ncbi:flagellar motor switch protein FliN [Aeoliella mucimassa]|uniref:Flagellar motor switch protein FliN n=1 Tax=Aeoliella mucimassa TaxID=2527972 RepID=A0A518AKP1_9BACT|nr:flagellar motor switch protein FliN [Aeoliella mucimassa]QDU55308.1 Flagellar motor switch protein FliN [Aeoliella mucimassa]
MADDNLGQDDIERLLAEAQKASGQSPAPSSEPDPPTPPPAEATPPPSSPPPQKVTLDQSELDAMLSGMAGGTTPPPPEPPKAAAPAATPPTPPPAPSSSSTSSNVSQNDIELLLSQAEQAIASIDSPNELPPGIEPFRLDDFGGTPANTEAATLELVRDVQLDLKIELGRTHMHIEDVLRLSQGAVVPLDKLAGDPVDLYVNGRMIARGEVLVLNDNFCVRVTELIVGDSACA